MSNLVVQEKDGKWVVGLVSPGTDRIYLQYKKAFDTAPEAYTKRSELEKELYQANDGSMSKMSRTNRPESPTNHSGIRENTDLSETIIPCPFDCLHCGAHYLGIECSGKVGKQVPKWSDCLAGFNASKEKVAAV